MFARVAHDFSSYPYWLDGICPGAAVLISAVLEVGDLTYWCVLDSEMAQIWRACQNVDF